MQGVTHPSPGMVAGSCGQKYRHEPKPGTGDWVTYGNNFSFWISPAMLPAVRCWTPLPRGSGVCIALQHLHPISSPSILPGAGKFLTILASSS